jgi:hypothetical protein
VPAGGVTPPVVESCRGARNMAVAVSAIGEAASGEELRLGSFRLGRRLDERPYDRPPVVAMEAVGITGSPFESRAAILRCFPINLADPACGARAGEAATRLRAVQHRAIAPILEAGVAGDVAFVVEERPEGIPLAQALTTNGKLAPLQVKRLVDDVAAGLAVAHGAGLRHGSVTPANVWLINGGGAVIGGYVFGDPVAPGKAPDRWRPAGERKAALDQYQLALTAAAALTGAPPAGAGGVPDSLPGVPAVVAAVLHRATAANPEERFPDLYAFAHAFGQSIADAGSDLIAGLWEATSRKDSAMAEILFGMAEAYAPDHQDLDLLRLRLNGGPAVSVGDLARARQDHAASGSPAASPSPPIAPATPEEEAIAALLMPPRVAASAAPRKNPWVAFAAGTFACVLLLVLATALTLAYL